jgi:hypothetical protein
MIPIGSSSRRRLNKGRQARLCYFAIMHVSGRQHQGERAAVSIADGVELCVAAAFGDAGTMRQAPPFSAARAAAAFDAGTVDEHLARHILSARQGRKDVLPDPALSPADKAIAEGLLRAADLTRTIGPAPAILQGVDDP